jgi:UDP-glucuronate 4-epimerase
MKKTLVTGAAGFIAHKVCQLLLEQGVSVLGIDNMNDYYDVNLKEYRLELLRKYPNFEFQKTDIESLPDLKTLFSNNRFTTVYNLAARAGVRYSLTDPWVYLRTNAEGTLNLLELMKEHDVKKFILASTSSLYAGLPLPFNEDLPVNTPISPYAASKKAAEMLAYAYHRQYGIDVSVLRYFTVYGPLGRPDMSIYRFIKWTLAGAPITLYGDGTYARDFTYVDDIARGTILAEKELGYEIINLGGGTQPVNMLTIIQWIEELTCKKATINHLPVHSADMEVTRADIQKAERLLGWKPLIPTRRGLELTIAEKEQFRFKLPVA